MEHKPVENYADYYPNKYPIYCETDTSTMPKGMYLGLFHGSEGDERPDMPNWGFNGPMIGPLKFVHTTYCADIKLQFEEGANYKQYGFEDDNPTLYVREDCIAFDGNLYGDWTVFTV